MLALSSLPSLDSIWHASLWDGLAILRVGFLIPLNLSVNKLIDAPRGVFAISLDESERKCIRVTEPSLSLSA